ALVTGVAGFAFGLVAAGVWLHILTPMQTATLIIAFGLVVQGISVWKLRHALRWSRLWPFLLGAAFGVPLGVAILGWARPDYVRVTVGVVLVLYSAYSLARPAMKPVKAGGATADAGVGFLNGILGGLTGLAGILPTIWCGLRGSTRSRTTFWLMAGDIAQRAADYWPRMTRITCICSPCRAADKRAKSARRRPRSPCSFLRPIAGANSTSLRTPSCASFDLTRESIMAEWLRCAASWTIPAPRSQ